MIKFRRSSEREGKELIRIHKAEYESLLITVNELQEQRDELLAACKTALWELQGHLQPGTAQPFLEATIDEVTGDDDD